MSKICYVTAFLNIGRSNWKNFSRSVDNYIDSFLPYIELFENNRDSDCEMVVYIDETIYSTLKEKIGDDLPIKLIPINEDYLLKEMPIWSRLEREQEIMNSDLFKTMVGSRVSFPEAHNARYTLINHLKIDFICHTLVNHTSAEYLCWTDFGYFKQKNRIPMKMLDINKLVLDKINYTLINPLEDIDRDVFYTLRFAKEKIGGFFFFGRRDVLVQYQQLYHETHQELQNDTIVDDDQSIALQCWAKKPEMFAMHYLGDWHLALLAFQQTKESFSIVMPVKINSNNGYQIFHELGLKSYEKYLNTTNLDFFYIITPSEDVDKIKELVKNSTIPFECISEEDLLNEDIYPVDQGWIKQQLIKLIMTSKISSPYCLIVDCDMYLTQPLCFSDLFHNGKLKYHSEPWQTENNKYFSQNSNWWKSSCETLGMNVSELYDDTNLMSVTPQVLVPGLVQLLIKELNTNYGKNWQNVFYDKRCTEFTLYWLLLKKELLTHIYTHEGFPLWKHSLEHSVLDYSNANEKVVQTSFTQPQSYFAVIQGYLQVDITPLIKEGVRCLNRPNINAIVIVSATLSPKRYQYFSIQDRHRQALETCNSIRKHIPSSICVFIDGSEVTTELQKEYQDVYDHLLFTCGNKEIDSQVNHPDNIGFGECKLLHVATQYIKQRILPYYDTQFIIKLSARYTLSDTFSLSRFNEFAFNFSEKYDENVKSNVLITVLYTTPPRYLHILEKLLLNTPNLLGVKYEMVENMYYNEIPTELISFVNSLGVQGRLSYNGENFHH